jgi:thiol-disulfide isomerase/thioredoxin
MKAFLTIILCILIFSSLGQDHKISIGDYNISSPAYHSKLYTDTSIHPAKIPAIIDSIKYIYYDENFKIIDSITYLSKIDSGNFRGISWWTQGERVIKNHLIKMAKLELQWVDKTVPDFTFIDTDGKKWDQNSIKRKPTIFHFWFTKCPPCVKEFSYLNEMSKKYPGALWFAISYEDSTTVKQFVKNHKINLIAVSNQKEWIKQFQVETYPRTIIIDKESKIKDVLYGAYQDSTLLQKRLNIYYDH